MKGLVKNKTNHKTLLIKAPYKPTKKHVLPALVQSAPSEPPILTGNYGPMPPQVGSFPRNIRSVYPFPSIPGAPISPYEALEQYSALLTKSEVEEIEQFPQIYWIRKDLNPDNSFTHKRPQTHRNFFPFEKDGHIIFRFQQLSVIGCGAYGIAIRCFDHKTKKQYILKIIHDNEIIHPQVEMELKSLRLILSKESHSNSIVRLYEDFTYHNYQFFVFEILGTDIYSTLKNEGFVGFDKTKLQIIFRQVSEALSFIHGIGIIHCDIKPENILWTDSRKLSIKVIDFGCSCFVGKTMFKYIQSRYYRAPEVILGIPYNQAIDVWSLGCMMAELATGEVLFPGHNEEEQILYFISVLGLPPSQMLAKASKRKQFFADDGLPLAYSRNDDDNLQNSNDNLQISNDNLQISNNINKPSIFQSPTSQSLNTPSNLNDCTNLTKDLNLNLKKSEPNLKLNHPSLGSLSNQKTIDNHYFGLPMDKKPIPLSNLAQNSSKSNKKWELKPPIGLMRKLKINDSIFISLLQQCLKWNPDERIRAKDILRHPWLKQVVPKL